jgi:uncharacterized protein (DUF1684 family)
MNSLRYFLSLVILLLASCNDSQQDLGTAPVPDNYAEEINIWDDERIETLKEPTGWMRLAGMFVLDDGENSFGSGPDRDVQFPGGTIPDNAGIFHLQDGKVEFTATDDVTITHDGKPVTEMNIFDGENAPPLQHGSLEWHVIQRQDLIAIRLYNKENPKVDMFDGFPRFPTDSEWHLNAQFEPNPQGTTIPITNVLGQVDQIPNPGSLTFRVNDQNYTIEALEVSDNRLFLIVGDETNQTDTYQAGRYIYVDAPDESGHTIIDFNKIYNPPCAYTVYSTCQLPPQQNRLDLTITAGEKRPVNWTGL